MVAGFPVVDVKVQLVDAKYHDVDSSVRAFEIASRAAFREALQKGKSVLLEPIMKVEVVTPEEYTGSVIGDLNSRRGQIQGQDMRGNANVINAMVPLMNMFGYVNNLRSMSQGRATFRCNSITTLRRHLARGRSAISACDRNACLNAQTECSWLLPPPLWEARPAILRLCDASVQNSCVQVDSAKVIGARRLEPIPRPLISACTCNWLCLGDQSMISRPFVGLVLAAAVAFSGPALAKDRANPIKMFDSDNDGTLDLAEVKKAASAMFAKLDPDRDGTLDARELRGRLSAKELAAADPDHDGTLTLDEYLAVVEQRFNAANPDKDGTLDAKELRSPAGRALLRLMK